MQVGESILIVFGKGLGPIVHQREPVIGSIHSVDTVLYNKVTVSLFPLQEVSLFSCLNVFSVDFDKGVPVRPCVLVNKSETKSEKSGN